MSTRSEGGRVSVWTFSNLLSITRVLLVLPIAILMVIDDTASRLFAVGLIVVATLTDFFDGMIARKRNEVTEFGKIVDPVADKIAVGVVAGILAAQGKLPLWFLLAVLLRDGCILIGGIYLRRAKEIVLQSNEAGKWAVTATAALILFTILDPRGTAWIHALLLAVSSGLLLLSFALYLRRFLTVVRPGGTRPA